MTDCPCCGYKLGNVDASNIGKLLKLTRKERAIYDALAVRFGKMVSRNELAESVYGDDPRGRPDDPFTCISVTLARLRPKLAAVGISVEGVRGHGGGRRMVWRKS